MVLTFSLTWTLEIGVFYGGLSYGTPTAVAFLALIMFIPGLSAFVVRKYITREGFGDAGLRVGVKKYWLAAWLLMPAMAVAALAVTLALGWATFDLSLVGLGGITGVDAAVDLPLDPVLIILVNIAGAVLIAPWINILPAFGEEFGWRGYLQVKLAPLGRFRAYFLTGLTWGIWHAPVILQGHNYPDHPQLGILFMIVFCVLLGFIFGWLRDASGSVWVAALAHGSLNATGFAGLMVTRDFNTLLGPALTGVAGWLVMLAVIVWLARRGVFRSAGPAASVQT